MAVHVPTQGESKSACLKGDGLTISMPSHSVHFQWVFGVCSLASPVTMYVCCMGSWDFGFELVAAGLPHFQ